MLTRAEGCCQLQEAIMQNAYMPRPKGVLDSEWQYRSMPRYIWQASDSFLKKIPDSSRDKRTMINKGG